MNDVVKLILTCQVKDDKIPQLIPLMWIISIYMWILLSFIFVDLYYYKIEYNIEIISKGSVDNLNYLW